jgi:hypothetical protein
VGEWRIRVVGTLLRHPLSEWAIISAIFLVSRRAEGGQEMDDEGNQGGEEEAQNLAGGGALAPDLRPDLFEVPAQGPVGSFNLECQGVEAFLQAGQGGFLGVLRVPGLLQRTAAGLAPAKHGVG